MEITNEIFDTLIASRRDDLKRLNRDTTNANVYYCMKGFNMGYIQALEFIKELKNKKEL